MSTQNGDATERGSQGLDLPQLYDPPLQLGNYNFSPLGGNP